MAAEENWQFGHMAEPSLPPLYALLFIPKPFPRGAIKYAFAETNNYKYLTE